MTTSTSSRASLRLLVRRPLVADVRELGRRPGSARPLVATVPAPDDVGTPVLHVPAGSPLELDLVAESVVEGVLVSGTVSGRLQGECARCLDPLDLATTGHVQVLYTYDPAEPGQEGDGDVAALEGDLADLEPALRDALVLDLPLAPLCDEDCEGLCDGCGERRETLPADHAHDVPDPRWAALADLADRLGTPTTDDPDPARPGAQEE